MLPRGESNNCEEANRSFDLVRSVKELRGLGLRASELSVPDLNYLKDKPRGLWSASHESEGRKWSWGTTAGNNRG